MSKISVTLTNYSDVISVHALKPALNPVDDCYNILLISF